MDYVAYAHTSHDADGDWQTLQDHLDKVAKLTKLFCKQFGFERLGYNIGMLHDLGKVNPSFQKRLMGSNELVDHSTYGGKYLINLDKSDAKTLGYSIAPIIMGHHGGLPNRCDVSRRLANSTIVFGPDILNVLDLELENYSVEDLLKAINGYVNQADLSNEQTIDYVNVSMFVISHLLFSSLVDADWLDTERHMTPEVFSLRNSVEKKSVNELLNLYNVYMDNLLSHIPEELKDTPLNKIRNHVNKACYDASFSKSGIYSLSVPTGGGKTLASMRFALNHAKHNGQHRIIYAIPFTSIVEQTAGLFETIFGVDNILEHTSNTDYSALFRELEYQDVDEEVEKKRLLSQNWDSPIVVTTNVQLFESLFSNGTFKSRKVHNIANSVVVLDEVQTIPVELLKPTLAVMEVLSNVANVTFVLCTATQPDMDKVMSFSTGVTEIVKNSSSLYNSLSNRVKFDFEKVFNPEPIEDIASELSCYDSCMCVVNTKKIAKDLYLKLKDECDNVYHLSASMTPDHRSDVLNEIRKKLDNKEPCHLVSTQLIEAGVDIDFPVVYRQVCSMDSLLQAAGRCNREGRLADVGKVFVFDLEEDEYTLRSEHSISQDISRCKPILKEIHDAGLEDIDTCHVKRFFKVSRGRDIVDYREIYAKHFRCNPNKKVFTFDYKTISENYKFIEEDTVGIFIPYSNKALEILDDLENGTFDLNDMSAVGRNSVAVPYYLYKEMVERRLIKTFKEMPVPILETGSGSKRLYSSEYGLDTEFDSVNYDSVIL